MIVRNISLYIDFDSGFEEGFRIDFNSEVRFINNYLSRQVRSLKIPTDGTFNMISVSPSKEIKFPCRIVGEKALQVRIPFDQNHYSSTKGKSRYAYYLKLLKDGYELGKKCKPIPIKELQELSSNFEKAEYKNEWLHKKKTFKEFDIKVELYCAFTATNFKLNIQIDSVKEKRNLISENIFTTAPYEVAFKPLFKDIIVQGESLIITEIYNRPKVKISLVNIYNKNFTYEVLENGLEYEPYSD